MRLKDLAKFFRNFGQSVSEVTEVYQNAEGFQQNAVQRTRQICVDAIQACFDASHDADGYPWAPLKYRDGKPLILTWRLRAESAYAAAVMEVNKRYLLIEQNEPFYYKYHLFGTARIPARPWGIGDNQRREIAKILSADMRDFVVQYINDNVVRS